MCIEASHWLRSIISVPATPGNTIFAPPDSPLTRCGRIEPTPRTKSNCVSSLFAVTRRAVARRGRSRAGSTRRDNGARGPCTGRELAPASPSAPPASSGGACRAPGGTRSLSSAHAGGVELVEHVGQDAGDGRHAGAVVDQDEDALSGGLHRVPQPRRADRDGRTRAGAPRPRRPRTCGAEHAHQVRVGHVDRARSPRSRGKESRSSRVTRDAAGSSPPVLHRLLDHVPPARIALGDRLGVGFGLVERDVRRERRHLGIGVASITTGPSARKGRVPPAADLLGAPHADAGEPSSSA